MILDDGERLGARADQRHLAAQDVPQLGKLVELGAAQEAAQGCDSPVVAGGDHGRAICAFEHGSELQHVEGLPPASGPPGAIERRPPRGQLHRDPHHQQERKEHGERDGGNRQIDQPFDRIIGFGANHNSGQFYQQSPGASASGNADRT